MDFNVRENRPRMTLAQAELRNKLSEFGLELTPNELFRLLCRLGLQAEETEVQKGKGLNCNGCLKSGVLVNGMCVDCLVERPMLRRR
jgi:hypothetical protein